MKLAEFTEKQLAKKANSDFESMDVTITNIKQAKDAANGLKMVVVETKELGVLKCLKNQIQNPIEDCSEGVSATITLAPHTYIAKEGNFQGIPAGTSVDTMRVTNIILHVLTAQRQAELKTTSVKF